MLIAEILTLMLRTWIEARDSLENKRVDYKKLDRTSVMSAGAGSSPNSTDVKFSQNRSLENKSNSSQ